MKTIEMLALASKNGKIYKNGVWNYSKDNGLTVNENVKIAFKGNIHQSEIYAKHISMFLNWEWEEKIKREEITWIEGIKLMCEGKFVDIVYVNSVTKIESTYVMGKNQYDEFALFHEKTHSFDENQFLDSCDILEGKWYKRV